MRFLFIKIGKASQVFRALAKAALAERLLEMKFGKRHTVGNITMN